MRRRESVVRLEFQSSRYPRESLEAAGDVAAANPGVSVFLGESGCLWRVELRRARAFTAAERRSLAGAFADEALNHAYRQKVVRLSASLTSAALAHSFERGFRPVPADPLEELEPQVKLDRERDLERLLAEARALGAI